MSVIVLGSANLDTAIAVSRHPGPGETVLGGDPVVGAGGKGVNQAIAAARAGANSVFAGAVGVDDAGSHVGGVLAADGVRAYLGSSDRPTGAAVVLVDALGENAIVVVQGANGDSGAIVGPARVAARGSTRGDVLVAQLEVPVEVVVETFATARGRGAVTVLNAAPSRPLPDALWDEIGILVVNQHECLDLAGAAGSDIETAARVLGERVGVVVVTLGAQGALLLQGDVAQRIPAFPAEAVDTTAAGDTFCGAFAARLDAGDGLDGAVRFASAAAALCVQRRGAAESAPFAAEIEEFLGARTVRMHDG